MSYHVYWRSNGSFGIIWDPKWEKIGHSPSGHSNIHIPTHSTTPGGGSGHREALRQGRSARNAWGAMQIKSPQKKTWENPHFFKSKNEKSHRNPWWKWWLLMIVNINDTGVFMADDDDDVMSMF